MKTAAELAQDHWNETPLFVSAGERYALYPWLPEAAEFTSIPVKEFWKLAVEPDATFINSLSMVRRR